ncbi:MAG TPA: C40 family peptidase [Segetibacter sp.]|nr:C40 family peptidase [Segetibacter sp.]
MAYLVCVVPVCPLRAEAAHKSEQTTQLLFGERGELLEIAEDFVRIRVLYDNYEGWCQSSQLEESTDEEVALENITLAGEWINKVRVNDQVMQVPFGSSLPLLNIKNFFGKYNVVYHGTFIKPSQNNLTEEMVKKLAFTFLNSPYLWGGRSVFGVDCSGFIQLVFKFMNIRLHRDAHQQATQGSEVDFLQEIHCGDLAFFDNEAGKITHTGILLNSTTIIHASGKVRVDSIDDLGIINNDTGKRTHNLKVIKRVVE